MHWINHLMKYCDIIKENKRRLATLTKGYHPDTGHGSLVPRFEFMLKKNTRLMLPLPMKDTPPVKASLNYDSYEDFLQDAYQSIALPSVRAKYIQDEIIEFHKMRVQYDFEFWTSTCVKIKSRLGYPVNFSLNYPQRILLQKLEELRVKGYPIRIILLKARQWGGSTLVQIYQQWIMLFIETGFSLAVAAHVESSASHIRGMFTYMAEQHPKEIADITLLPYEGTKHRIIKGRKNVIGIGSYEKPENLRGLTFQLLHLSEVASMRETLGKKPEEFAQALRAFVPSTANTLVVLESTAKGVGNFFHREYMAAKTGTSGYTPVFIPWFWIEEYMAEVRDYKKFISGMDERAWELWALGATLEGIKWYKRFKRRERYSDWEMMEEFPSTANEAFVSSGQRVFPQQYTIHLRDNCCEPEMVGELQGGAITGPGSLKGIKFVESPHGGLWVWTPPDTESKPIKDRYVVFMDIGGTKKDADKSVIRVLDRYWMVEGGQPEFVATWRGNIDHDLLAWKGAQIARWYNNALFLVESNSLDKKHDGEGHFYTILNEIADFYDNLFARTTPDKIKEGAPIKYGFHTDRKTKPEIIDTLKAAARDHMYVERDARAVDEMDTYEIKPNGALGAQDGCFDDMVVTSAGCLWAATVYLDKPKYYQEYIPEQRSIISEASI